MQGPITHPLHRDRTVLGSGDNVFVEAVAAPSQVDVHPGGDLTRLPTQWNVAGMRQTCRHYPSISLIPAGDLTRLPTRKGVPDVATPPLNQLDAPPNIYTLRHIQFPDDSDHAALQV